MMRRTAYWEIGVSLVFIAGCGVVLWQTRDIPAGTFEPLGSAPVPQAVSCLIILLSAVVLIKAVARLRAVRSEAVPNTEPATVLGHQSRPRDALVVGALTLAYVLAMDARLMSFAPLTTIFLTIVIAILARFRLKSLPAAIVVAAVTGWGCQFIFTRVFVVDLPGL